MTRFKKALLAALALTLCMATLTGCAVGKFDVNKKIVCEVDGEPVTYDEYKYFFYRHHTDLYGSAEVALNDEMFNKVKAMTEDSLRRKATIMRLIDEYGIKLDDEQKDYVDEMVEAQIELYEGEQGYKDFLLEGRATGTVFRDQILLTFGYDPALREIFKMGANKDIVMTDEAILASVQSGQFYRYQYAYFALTEGKNSVELEKEAKEFLAGVKNGANTFKNEDYDIIGQRTLGFEQAILALDEGEVSEVLWGADWGDNAGYYVFKRLPIDVEHAKTNMERFEIEDEYFASTYLKYISEQSNSIEIEYAKYFDSIDYATLLKKEELK
ncbi:MAG: hypothetical protein IKB51_01545 [Clostridia bacterium]|nr:hypothetical protein [Clostridia bacterium]